MDFILQSSMPIGKQLYTELQELVATWRHPAGPHFPPVRELASDAGVNQNTMQRAVTMHKDEGMKMKALEIKNLKKSYGKNSVIRGLDLILEEGEVFGLIGPNGAGKSTLVILILNLIKKDSGEIIFFENNLENYAAEVGATIEEPSFYAYMTGKENLDIYKNLLNLSDDDVYAAMEMTGIRHASNKKLSAYSMGMKQRLAISRAIISKPKLLILDEPTNGLDPKAILELRDIVHKLNELGTTIIFCSHNLSEVKHICDTYGFLEEGTIKFKKEIGDSVSQIDEMESLFL